MGNHRADRRGPSRRPSDQPTPSGGKRRAEKPTRSTRRESVEPTPAPLSLEDESTIVIPVTNEALEPTPTGSSATYQSYRVGGVRSAPAPRTGLSQPGARRSASRAPLFRVLPSAPMVLGVAALAVSAGGALTVAGGLGSSDSPRISQASALSGVSNVSRVNLLGREVVSRDSRRDALDDAADAQLQDKVEEQSRQRDAAMAKLAQETQAWSDKLALNQWILPVSGYHLTARFGDYSGLWSHFHTGLDFAAPSGTPIHAIADGVVTSVGYDGSYGNKTVITLDDGTEIWYCHQTSYVVSEGDTISQGELIGYVGSTGNVTGPHLHLEVRPGAGDPVDPYTALVAHGVTP
ncbi:M23 family metallopeptidase [Nocardioides mangrovi]|uniref:Peptidoglycan DD-metalloendopeptidase family protein n=1 Tax=Nocardioides mangrovi TaxID=2874580 RepID=A0ABS7UH26_9ACTN|nr:peptidoglycan DD-metalloendopeptidase family protein [Nocardioides mangrovi]MBZ5740182.1 peptidoglycan DD-metalloendopeptidase family protein [Nocardioides mangrovi]